MTIYICKMCGRAMESGREPKYCYADCMNVLEGISNEDAKKGGFMSCLESWMDDGVEYEFASDIRFDPFTGESKDPPDIGNGRFFNDMSLGKFQDKIMTEVTA